MRFFVIFGLLIGLACATYAQDTPPAPDYSETIARLEQLVQAATAAAEQAEKQTEWAFNLLGLFEAIGVFITVGGVLAAFFGITQIVGARRELLRTNEELKAQAAQMRADIETEIRRREEELNALRTRLETFTAEFAAQTKEHTSRALIANSLVPLGERQYRASDYDGALNIYTRALELDPNNPTIHQRLGYVYTQKSDLERAKYHYEQAIKLEPDFAPALAGLGFVTRRIAEKLLPGIEQDRMYNEAERLLLNALQITPKLVDDDGESWWGVLGGLYRRREQLEQAINAYERATRVTPQSSYGYGNLALLYRKKNQREKMLKMYERVEKIAEEEARRQQGNFWGYADLIVSRYALGKAQLADEILPIAIDIAPVDAPYMLSGLRDTLQDLTSLLEEDKLPPIQLAIATLERVLEERQKLLDARAKA